MVLRIAQYPWVRQTDDMKWLGEQTSPLNLYAKESKNRKDFIWKFFQETLNECGQQQVSNNTGTQSTTRVIITDSRNVMQAAVCN